MSAPGDGVCGESGKGPEGSISKEAAHPAFEERAGSLRLTEEWKDADREADVRLIAER